MSTTTLDRVEYRPLVIPESIDAEDAADFRAMTEVRNAVYRYTSGHDDHSMSPGELLPNYRTEPYEIRLSWLVLDDGRPVGRVGLDLPIETESRVAYLLIELLPDVRGRGIGTRALELVERVAREHGRSVLQSWAEHPDRPGPRLEPPTGFGSIPADDPGARFYVRHGFTLEQIERNSAFDLRGPFDEVDRLFEEATAAAEGYRIVSWNAPTPPRFAEGYAWMKSRMVTDAPAAAIEYDEEKWDAERVALGDARAIDGGRLLHVTAAQHIPTGGLCAFNELAIGPDRTAASHQEDTLVLRAHRGHRLGMLVKCAGLRAWRELVPDSPRVITYNAEENRPMLDINEAIGFVPIAYEGAWKKVLDA
ncbi:GNAT family N-acetyltransferase [Microbacterium sp.]|jgi:GNAT superfamily N-acetyltransferase|uniref:GNAT family N-acetyltransferase n=1 Tax=Microbacterium sp. TaxID=51671 RepID=UPI0037C6FC24